VGRPLGGAPSVQLCASHVPIGLRVEVVAVEVEVGFEPTEDLRLTRFRVLRTTVHHRPPVFLTSADS
jgi:hypothetical protein